MYTFSFLRRHIAIITLLVSSICFFWASQAHAAIADRFFYPLESWNVAVHDGEKLGGGRYHAGIDAGVELPAGAAVYSIANGIVREAQERSLFGEVILIEHELEDGDKIVSLYGHLWPGKSLVKPGDTVKAGQQIGVLGTTKNNGGWVVHLHFGIHSEPYTGEWKYWGHVTSKKILNKWLNTEDFLSERAAKLPTPRIVDPRHVLALQYSDNGTQGLRLYNSEGRLRFPLNLTPEQEEYLRDITVSDIDNDGKPNIIGVSEVSIDVTASSTDKKIQKTSKQKKIMISVFTRKGRFVNEFEAFVDPTMKGGARVTTGDVDGDGQEEIIVGSGRSSSADRIKVFEQDGTLVAIMNPFANKRSTRGVDVATGDVDGDGRDEIIAGRRKGKSTIAILTVQGQRLDVFRAYEANYKKGVNIAAGDVDGDTKDEIIVAPNGQRKGEVFVFEQRLRRPTEFNRRTDIRFVPFKDVAGPAIDVSVVDWENDGTEEIQMSVIKGEGGHIKTYRYAEKKRVLYDRVLGGKKFTHGARIAGWIIPSVVE